MLVVGPSRPAGTKDRELHSRWPATTSGVDHGSLCEWPTSLQGPTARVAHEPMEDLDPESDGPISRALHLRERELEPNLTIFRAESDACLTSVEAGS